MQKHEYVGARQFDIGAGEDGPANDELDGGRVQLGSKRIRSDAEIAVEVHDRIHERDDIDAHRVDASVHEGVVVLSGVAPDEATRYLVEEICAGIRGVIQIVNTVDVEGHPSAGRKRKHGWYAH